MNHTKMNIEEDAKSDWMNIVKKHRKRQKGLPALSRLNTNAGNVEHNISMFNMMQPSGIASVDAGNGNVSAGMSEEFTKEDKTMSDKKVVLHYEELPIEVVTKRGNPGGYYDYGMGQWYPDEDETTTIRVDWEYEIDKISIIEVLQDLPEVRLELQFDSLSEEEFDVKLLDEFDILVEKYNDILLATFYEDAVEDAQQKYSYDYEYSFEESCEVKQSEKLAENLDDNFDMSMRTLL